MAAGAGVRRDLWRADARGAASTLRLLEKPALIQQEPERRLDAAQAADPTRVPPRRTAGL